MLRPMDIEEIVLELRPVIGKASLTLEVFLSLEPGDVVVLDQEVNAPIKVQVADEEIFAAYPGVHASYKAIKIEKVHE